MFAPVMKAHRVSVKQMALLEPALAEIVSATCITIVREAMEEVIQMGVPNEIILDTPKKMEYYPVWSYGMPHTLHFGHLLPRR
jgi:hypothetical protein